MSALRRCLTAARPAARRWAADERGAAVVEFAVVVPVLLTFIMAVIDFGRMMAIAASLASAVRDGARHAATVPNLADGTQRAAVQARVAGAFQPWGGTAISAASVVVSTQADASGNVAVTVTGYEFRPITPIARLIGMGTIRFSRTATFRWERAT